MIVPQFWAEARRHQPRAKDQAQVTVRRFGWSDVSQADAQVLADERAQTAFDQLRSGRKIPRREPKVAYNGAKGVPIREEVLARHDEVVITRNSYGAHCLNTPDVLFADIDFNDAPSGSLILASLILLVAGAIAAGIHFHFGKLTFLFVFLAVILMYPLAAVVKKCLTVLVGGQEKAARRRIDGFLRRHPAWRVALYRTPAGFRVLALHAVFDPQSAEVAACFAALQADRVYVTMCRNQNCFRARVSPKPWRMGIAQHMRPRPGVWPVRPEQREKRQRWIKDYEAAAPAFASCAFIDHLGDGGTDPKPARVQALHDRLAQARSGRPIA
jgi:hypothetical protein